VLEAKARAEEAAATSAAALAAAERKAKQYRGDSTALLSDYDAWVQGLLAKKSVSGSGGTPPAAPAAATAPAAVGLASPLRSSLAGSLSLSGAGGVSVPSHTSDAGRLGLASPGRDSVLSRAASHAGLASPLGAVAAAVSYAAAPDPDLEKYDRIAALLEARGVGSASLSRALSAKSAKSPALSPRGSTLTGAAATGKPSPRPGFR
jgi:hypothetical protein